MKAIYHEPDYFSTPSGIIDFYPCKISDIMASAFGVLRFLCYNNGMSSSQKDWDEYFMRLTETVASKSKDPSSKMGCVIVDQNKRVVSLGYNGMV